MTTLFAYIDPFTGSLVLQLLVAGFLSALVFFQKVKAFVFGLFGVKPKVESIDDTEVVASIPLEEGRTDDFDQRTKAA